MERFGRKSGVPTTSVSKVVRVGARGADLPQKILECTPTPKAEPLSPQEKDINKFFEVT